MTTWSIDFGDGKKLDTSISASVDTLIITHCYGGNLSTYAARVSITTANNSCIVTRKVQADDLYKKVIVNIPACSGESTGTIEVNLSDEHPPYTYFWSNGATTKMITGLSRGQYQVSITDGLGCMVVTKVFVEDPPELTAGVSYDCSTHRATAAVNGGIVFKPDTLPYYENFDYLYGTSKGSGEPPLWTVGWPDSSGTWPQWYVVDSGMFCGKLYGKEVWWRSQCIDLSMCNAAKLVLDIAYEPVGASAQDFLSLHYTVSGSAETLLWKAVQGNGLDTYPNLTEHSFSIPTSDCLQIAIRSRNYYAQYCFDNIRITCEPVAFPYNYLWCTGETTPAIDLSATVAGDCVVLITDSNTCTKSRVIETVIPDNVQPEFSYRVRPDCDGLEVTFTNTSLDGSSYFWDFGDGTFSSEHEPEHRFDYGRNYTVILLVGTGICAMKFSAEVKTSDYNPYVRYYVPMAFTPGNNGVNDLFQAKYDCILKEFEVKIFDRWGNVVFVSNDQAINWNGRYRGTGSMCQEDGYVWRMDYISVNNEKVRKFGHVSLIR